MPVELTAELIKTAIGLFFDVVDILLSVLPSAPFALMLAKIESTDTMNVLGYVNYFIPFKFCAICINLWLTCVIGYYVYKYLKQAINDYRSRHKI